MSSAHPALSIFLVAFALRVGYLTLTGRSLVRPDDFAFGWETGRIAQSLVAGRGFADPFDAPTGPTSWLAPVYPLILAGIFAVFGPHSSVSAFVALAFNSACSAATAILIYWIGGEVVGETFGRRAGWVWALFPYAVAWPTRIVWDTSLVALLLAWVFFLTLRLAREGSLRLWATYGAAWGLVALTNPAPLAFAPVSWVWSVVRGRRAPGFRARHVLAAAAVLALCVSPWVIRNRVTFGSFVFLRSNFGEELRLGNGPGAGGEWMGWLHPVQNPGELQRYRILGERAYVAERGREAVDFIVAHPASFLANTVRRVYWFWCGTAKGEEDDPWQLLRRLAYAEVSLLSITGLWLMGRENRPVAVLFGGLLLLYPLVYYVTFVVPRYRQPIDPETFLLALHALTAVPAIAANHARGLERSRGSRHAIDAPAPGALMKVVDGATGTK